MGAVVIIIIHEYHMLLSWRSSSHRRFHRGEEEQRSAADIARAYATFWRGKAQVAAVRHPYLNALARSVNDSERPYLCSDMSDSFVVFV